MAAVAQIIGPLAGVFNIVTAAVPMIIGAVKLFASPLGLKVLAAIALGILAFKGGEWIVNKLAGGAEFVEAEKKLGARIQAQEGIVGRFGMTDAGYLLKPDPNNPGKFLKERYIVRNQKGMITDATVFTKRPDGSYYANDEQRAAYKKLESDKKKLALIKKNKDSEIKNYTWGKTQVVKPEYDAAIEKKLKKYFDKYHTIALPNYSISNNEMSEVIGSDINEVKCIRKRIS